MTPSPRLGLAEFTVLIAFMFAFVASAIDTMLPALGMIADDLSPQAPNRAQFVITSFVAGMGLGTFFTGPLSDAVGRRGVIFGGYLIFALGSVLSFFAPTIELMVLARFLQGLGVSGPRIAAMAVVRDLYEGRQMARVMSLAMMIFVLVPAVAPLAGAWIAALAGWRAIFLALVLFSSAVTIWFMIRQAETLPKQSRIPLRRKRLLAGLIEILGNRYVRIVIAGQTLALTVIFVSITTTQPAFEHTFDRASSFPMWFALMSVLSASGGFLNARIVERLGMRHMVLWAMIALTVLSALMLLVVLNAAAVPPALYFGLYFLWMLSSFICAGGFAIGNLNSMALEPLGHIAGLASSIVVAIATLGSALIVAFAGGFFDGTPLVQVLTVGLSALVCAALMMRI